MTNFPPRFPSLFHILLSDPDFREKVCLGSIDPFLFYSMTTRPRQYRSFTRFAAEYSQETAPLTHDNDVLENKESSSQKKTQLPAKRTSLDIKIRKEKKPACRNKSKPKRKYQQK